MHSVLCRLWGDEGILPSSEELQSVTDVVDNMPPFVMMVDVPGWNLTMISRFPFIHRIIWLWGSCNLNSGYCQSKYGEVEDADNELKVLNFVSDCNLTKRVGRISDLSQYVTVTMFRQRQCCTLLGLYHQERSGSGKATPVSHSVACLPLYLPRGNPQG
jgi:hypothetical protein